MPGAVGRLHRVAHFARVQQAVVQVLRQQAVGEVPTAGEHCVLVRAEARQEVFDEVVEAAQGPGA